MQANAILKTNFKETDSPNNKTIKVIFVCHGNICRSPMAEAILKWLVETAPYQDRLAQAKIHLDISSAACTNDALGMAPHQETKRVLLEHQIDPNRYLQAKTARKLMAADFQSATYILAMDCSNIYKLKKLKPETSLADCQLLLSYSDSLIKEVADPWYTHNFEKTYNDILKGCQAWLDYILDESASPLRK